MMKGERRQFPLVKVPNPRLPAYAIVIILFDRGSTKVPYGGGGKKGTTIHYISPVAINRSLYNVTSINFF